ncbi:conserved hypothetical protein [Hyella patelloides LEGE 07179]|uniref:NB-ARC domain-containing protein n=1 Tax=Hyella patelloides LEGE 07179 TaxID=945734 RepID=A0A563VNE4_9CYAN|nr:NB-ARC domain-containing protein [Hyella patelloides]VEP12986.1 conserved hypothetical protein [Hyella patelloides LEGE 07179]
MNRQKQKRSRGLIFTSEGWQKFQAKKQDWESENKSGIRCTLEELSELTGLAYNTVLKVVEREKGVDKRSLVKFSMAFDLELSPNDYISLSSLNSSDDKHAIKKVDWDEFIETPFFYGRTTELTLLEKWVVTDRCKLVTIQGIGGIGKTALCARLVKQVEHKFDYVIWRSLKTLPSLKELLADLLQVLFGESQLESNLSSNISCSLRQLISYLRSHRCLIVLDNLDAIMQSGAKCGAYIKEYHDYGRLIKYLGETLHQSCLLLTTREKPQEVALMAGEALPVRCLRLDGLSKLAAQKILLASNISGTEAEQNRLIQRYSGHPLALKIVAQKINSTSNRKIARFFQQDNIMLEELRQLLSQHIERLSSLERKILCKLAIFPEPVSFSGLRKEISLSVSSHKIIDSLESLSRRSLIVRKSAFLTMHPIINLYVTNNT